MAIIANDSCSFNGKLFSCMQLSESLPKEQQSLWPWILWRLWKLRNELVFQGKQPDIIHGFNSAVADHYEWLKNTSDSEQRRDPSPHPVNEILAWIPLDRGRLKCNTDATWHKDKKQCGAAWILREDTGRVRFWGAKTFPKFRSALEAEATALIWAVSCIGNMGYKQVDFETDSSSLVEALKHPSTWPRLLSYTTEFHGKCNKDDRDFQVQKVRRERNKMADAVAHFAQAQDLYFGTIENLVPLWLQPFLDAYVI